MAYVYFCNNPLKKCIIGDCVIRAISKALHTTWDNVYIDLVMQGYSMKDMPSSNEVWRAYLNSKGFRRYSMPTACTIGEFADTHKGTYVVGTGTHAVCVEHQNFYDTWNSKDELISFYYEREDF